MRTHRMRIAAVAMGIWGGGCCTIHQPIVTDSHDKILMVDVTGDIRRWQANGELAVDYRTKFRTEFANLNDANLTLYLLLQAIEYESRHGDKVLARQMLEFAREEAVRHDAGVTVTACAPFAKQIRRTEAQIRRNFATP